MNKYVIILAAGKGTHMKSINPEYCKVAFPVLGKPMINYVLDTVKKLEPKKIVTVVGFGGELTKQLVEDDSEVVWQHDVIGTGEAVKQARKLLEGKKGVTLIMYGDTPLVSYNVLEEALQKHIKEENVLTVVSAVLNDPTGYGRIIREEKSNRLLSIREEKDCSVSENEIQEVNTGICFIDNEILFNNIDRITKNKNSELYYLSQLVELLHDDGLRVGAYVARDRKEMFGVIDRTSLAYASKVMRKRINNEHMLNGVSIEDPDTTYISPDVKIGRDTVIMPNTIIRGKCVIGESNFIGPNTYLENVNVGCNNNILSSWITDTEIGDNNGIGPYAKMRAGTIIENNCRVGNFVELKNAHYHDGVKSAHLTYIGDTEVGEKTNIGCMSVTANYDGFNKERTSIGKEVFVGSGTIMVAPLNVEDKSFIAAGSTITKNVKEDSLVIARSRETVLEHGYTVFRNKAKAKKDSKEQK